MKTVLHIIVLLVIVQWSRPVPLQSSKQATASPPNSTLRTFDKEKIIKLIIANHFDQTSEYPDTETVDASGVTSDDVIDYLFKNGYVTTMSFSEDKGKNATNATQNKTLIITRQAEANATLVHCKLCNGVHARNEECSKNKREIIIIGEPGDNSVFRNTVNSSVLKDLISSKAYKKLVFREVISESEKNILNASDDEENLRVRIKRGSAVKLNKTAMKVHKHNTTGTKQNKTSVDAQVETSVSRSVDSVGLIGKSDNNASNISNRTNSNEFSNVLNLTNNETQNLPEKNFTGTLSLKVTVLNSSEIEENSTSISRSRRDIMEHDHFKLNACEYCPNSIDVTEENDTAHQIHAEQVFAVPVLNMTMLYCTCAIAKPSARDAEKDELTLKENVLRLPTDQYSKEICLGVCMDSSRHFVNVHGNLYCSHSINEKTIPYKIKNVEGRREWIFCQVFGDSDQSHLRAFLSWMNLAILDVMMCVTIIGLAGMYLIYFVFWKGNKPSSSSNYKKTTFSAK